MTSEINYLKNKKSNVNRELFKTLINEDKMLLKERKLDPFFSICTNH